MPVETAVVDREEFHNFRKTFGKETRRAIAYVAAGTGRGKLGAHKRMEIFPSATLGRSIQEKGFATGFAQGIFVRGYFCFRFHLAGFRLVLNLGFSLILVAVNENRLSLFSVPATASRFLDIRFNGLRFPKMDDCPDIALVYSQRIRI